MSLLVEFRISGEGLKITELAAAVPDVTLEIERWVMVDDAVVWYLWARGEDLDRVSTECAALPNAEEVQCLGGGEGERLYHLTMDPVVDLPPDRFFYEGTVTEGYLQPDCLHLTGRVSARDVLTGVFEYLRSNDISISVTRLRRTGSQGRHQRLSDKQLEALEVADRLGYFDEDTRVTHEDIATELGVSRSAVSERLRRAQQQLVQSELSGTRAHQHTDRVATRSDD